MPVVGKNNCRGRNVTGNRKPKTEVNMTQASDKFLAAIRNDDAEIRYAAWSHAGETDPEVIPELAKLLVADKPGVRKAADESLKNIVHSVGKEPAGTRRAAVVRQFIALTASGPTSAATKPSPPRPNCCATPNFRKKPHSAWSGFPEAHPPRRS
ncbi:MAG: hypothetical protein DMG58_33280 [Acidobacteria bacterium]|nr:MAG: hypothetical protein DMG58_33280 [Acidobacteriota bacterium]